MSSPVSCVPRLLLLLMDRKKKLREEDIAFLQAFSVEERNNQNPVLSQTVQDSKLVHSMALLLKRLLEQDRLRSAGWQRAAYCRMVHTAATAMHSVCRRIMCHGQPAALISMSQQLAASGVLQQLPAALVMLSGLTQARTATDPSVEAAHAVLAAVAIIIAAWPGAAGVLCSVDAGPLALPAVELANILEQLMTTQSHTDRLQLCLVVRSLEQLVALNGRPGSQQHPYQLQLVQSPSFLRLLLIFIAIDLEPNPHTAVAENAEVTAATAAVAVAEGRQLTAAAAAAADTPYLSIQIHASSSTDTCPTTAACKKAAAGDSMGSLVQPAAANAPRQPDQGDSSSTTASCFTTASCMEAAEAVGHSGSSSHSSLQAATIAAASAPCNAAQQCISGSRQQQLLLLQHLHPAIQLNGSGETLQTLVQVLNFREGNSSGMLQLNCMIAVAGQCVDCIAKALRNFEMASHATGIGSSSSNTADRMKLCLPDGSITAALLVLPLLVMHVWPLSKETGAAALALYSAVSKVVCKTIRCWEVQLWLHIAGLPHGVSEHQLASARLQDELLRLLELAVQQQSSVQAATTGSDTVHGTSSTPAAAAGGDALAGAANKHAFIELLTMLGSREQQQLFTLLISTMKRARMLPKQVEVSKGAAPQLTALHGCELYEVSHRAASQMLQHHNSSSSSSSESLLRGSSAAGLAAAGPWLVVLSRNLVHLADQLDAVMHYNPSCDSWYWFLDRQYDDPFKKRHGSQMLRYSTTMHGWVNCVFGTIKSLLQGCNQQTDSAASNISSNSIHAMASRCAGPSTQYTAATAGRELLPQEAAAGANSSAEAALRHQRSRLLQVQQQLESGVLPKVEELKELCDLVYQIYLRDTVDFGDIDLRDLTADLKQMSFIEQTTRPGLAAAAKAMLAFKDSAAEFVGVLQQWGIQQLQQQLLDLGSQVCAALPLSGCCNNPGCSNMRGDSESVLVNGKGCVCAGCEVARYCGRECQAAHWQQHKVICKIIKRQRMSLRVTAV